MSQSLRSHMFAITALGIAFLGMITPAAAAPNPTQTVFISGNTPEQKQRLIQAVGAGNNKVVLAPIVDMDLSGPSIQIAGNTIFTGGVLIGPGVFGPARDASHRGPRLYTRTRPKPLFEVTGDVKIEGFRLIGPNFGLDADLPKGILINSHIGIEITNMELAGWSGAAISVQENDAVPGRLTPEFGGGMDSR